MARRKININEQTFDVFNHAFMIVLALSFLIPFLIIISTSFVSEQESARRGAFILFPEEFDLVAYRALLSHGSIIYNAYFITIFRVVVGTTLNLLFTCTLAYGLSKRNLPGRNVITTYVFFTMLFGGGLIPTYLVVKTLRLTDTIWALIFPGLISTWNLLVMRTFFSQIPESLEESATIDGASPLRILVSVVLPLSLPSIATIGLFYAVGHWDAWFDAAIYINDHKKRPMQIILREIVLTYSNQDVNNVLLSDSAEVPPAATLKSAAIVVSTLPILLVYPFIQKYFVKGVMIGAIKG